MQQQDSLSGAVNPSARGRGIGRRRLLWQCGAALAASSAGWMGYGSVYTPFHPVLERVTIPVPGMPGAFDGVRIVALSDIHIQPGFRARHVAPAIQLAMQQKPDLIVLLGDYLHDRIGNKLEYMQECAIACRPLSAPLGVYAVYGNHDFPPPPLEPPHDLWRSVGVRPLCDEVARISKGNDAIYLVGLRSTIARMVFPEDVLRLVPDGATKVVLWHEPDRALETALKGGALQLSGHTHGGQVVLPVIGPPLLPIGGKMYPSGLYQVHTMPLYVTRGVGLLPPMLRLNCPPEVTLITLRSAPAHERPNASR